MEDIRLNKFISEAGICSRREADRLIESGRVRVDGKQAVTGMRVSSAQQVTVDGRPVSREEERIFLAVHKPKGIVCTADKREKDNLIDFLHYPKKITYLGRLDKDSTGLILMTNDGDINNRMMRARNGHEKEYLVEVDREVTEEFVSGMSRGVPILDTVTKKCLVEKTGPCAFRIILTQGLNRQIRRMCEYFGYRVKKLHRIRVMNIELGDLKPGEYRRLTPKEIAELDRLTGSGGKDREG
ncbi:MAG: pseudouridine synthase [Lachnospiraceae bacterium]|nr:pseudouridine synthase [Lachnospiraceae bacterium]